MFKDFHRISVSVLQVENGLFQLPKAAHKMQNAFSVKQKPPKHMLILLFEILNMTIIHHFNRIYMKTENKYNQKHSLKILDGNKDLDQMGIL